MIFLYHYHQPSHLEVRTYFSVLWWPQVTAAGAAAVLLGKYRFSVAVAIAVYPLVMTNIAIENGHRNSGFSH